MNKQVIVLSPHPDDESLGCGGAIRRHVLDGDPVCLIFLTSGEGRKYENPAERARMRETEARAAAKILGVNELEFWRQSDGLLVATDLLKSRLREKISSVGVTRIYVTHENEAHPDHRAAAALVRGTLSGMPISKVEVRTYEVWTPIQSPIEAIDISDFIAEKRAAIRAHASQCAVLDFEHAVIGLNAYRGLMHCVPRGRYAEVFGSFPEST